MTYSKINVAFYNLVQDFLEFQTPGYNAPHNADDRAIIVCNEELKTISLTELTCLFNSSVDLTDAHHHKAQKPEYLQIVAELDRLGFSCEYHMVKIGCLDHFFTKIISAMKPFTRGYHTHTYCRLICDCGQSLDLTKIHLDH